LLKKALKNVPTTLLKLFLVMITDVFYRIKLHLSVLSIIMPVEVASTETNFTTIRKMKTWLWSRTSETRLTSYKLQVFVYYMCTGN